MISTSKSTFNSLLVFIGKSSTEECTFKINIGGKNFLSVRRDACDMKSAMDGSSFFPINEVNDGLRRQMSKAHVIENNSVMNLGIEALEIIHVRTNES